MYAPYTSCPGPKICSSLAAFEEMQIFMYAVMAEHLKTDKGKSLVSQFEKDHDAQRMENHNKMAESREARSRKFQQLDKKIYGSVSFYQTMARSHS
jgi:hypothetical protein